MKLLTLLILNFMAFNTVAQANVTYLCPDESRMEEAPGLGLDDVMHQYRDHLNEADGIISMGSANPSSVNRDDLKNAWSNVKGAQDCAAFVVRHYNSQMAPQKAGELTGEAKTKLLKEYLIAANEFYQLLKEYQESIQDLLARANKQNYKICIEKSMAVHDSANRSHRKF